MVSKELNQHITNSYKRWADYAKYQAARANIPDQAGDILNTVLEALLRKDQDQIHSLLAKKKDSYTELDFFILRMIRLNAHSPTSPYRHKTRTVHIDTNIDPCSIDREDLFDQDPDKGQEILDQCNQAREVLDTLNISSREKEIFSWKFFADNALLSWPGDESYSTVCATYNRVKALMAGKIKNPNTGKKRWSPKEIAYLRSEYQHTETFCIARYLGRNYKAVTRKAESLGLKKTSFTRRKIQRKNSPMTPRNPFKHLHSP